MTALPTPETHPELVAGKEFELKQISADGFDTEYWEAGSGQPILYMHPAGGPQQNLALDALAKTFRVIQLRLPGFGEEINERTQSASEMAQTVLKFADALGLDKFVAMGTSMGGVVATWLAIHGQDRVTQLVLEAPGAFRPETDPSQMSPEEMMRAFHAHPERKIILPPDQEAMHRTWPLVMRIMGSVHDEELEAKLSSISAQTLAIYGTKDGLFGTEPGRVYKREVPDCTYVHLYDAAHDIAGDRPEAFTSLVTDFVNRGAEFVISDESTVINP